MKPISTLFEDVTDLTAEAASFATVDSQTDAMVERVRRQQSALMALMKSSVLQMSEQAVFQAISKTAAETMGVTRVSIWRFSPPEDKLILCDLFDRVSQTHRAGAELIAARCPAYFETLKWHRVISVTDALVDPRTAGFMEDYLEPNHIVSMLDAGIWQGNQRTGIVCVESVNARRLWTPDEQQFAASLADLIVIHLENKSKRAVMQQLTDSQQRFSQVFSLSQDMMVISRLKDGVIVDVNASVENFSGYKASDIIGKSSQSLDIWVDPKKRDEWFGIFERDNAVHGLEVDLRLRSGDMRTFQLTSELIEFDGERCAITICRDYTDAKRQSKLVFEIAQGVAAATGATFFRSLVERLLTALDADIAFIGEFAKGDTSKIKTIAAHDRQGEAAPFSYDLAGSPCHSVLSQGVCAYPREVDKLFPLDVALVKNGIQGYVGAPMVNSSGVALGLIAVLFKRPIEHSDTAVQLIRIFATRAAVELERRDQLAQLQYRATTDLLTGLPNRTTLEAAMESYIAANRMSDKTTLLSALLLVDLDRFKEINVTLGHAVGDKVVSQIATRLQDAQRQGGIKGDAIARIGGDEFAVWLTDKANAQQILDAVLCVKQAMTAPLDVEGYPLEVSASIGVSIYPTNADSAQTLLRAADIAMYEAKKRGGSTVFYDRTFDPYSPERLTLMSQMSQAVKNQQFVVFYQPRTHLASGRAAGFEALVRWQHPTLGLLPPSQFIPLAELSDVIRPLTYYVLDQALSQLVKWRAFGDMLVISVNLSARNLMDDECAETIKQLIKKHRANAHQLELEITESVIIADPEKARKTLSDIHRMGVRISIDDFGTGFSSLSHLKRLPLHALKIDVSFVTHMLENEQDVAIVQSTIGLAHSLGLNVVAEGIEDVETESRLTAMGCDEGQGFYIARPMPHDEAEAWLTARVARYGK
jgi:diguanylate cyclase (GGDEF)-like protein/PAS domain S-box-containing protein